MRQLQSDPLRILVVEDDEDILRYYERVLCPKGTLDTTQSKMEDLEAKLFGGGSAMPPTTSFDLVACRQGDDGVEAVRGAMEKDKPFALAFIDVRLPPGPDGVWTAENIRALDPYLEIIMVTGYSDVDPTEIASRVSPEDKLLYLQKPLHIQEIRQFASALGAKWRAETMLREGQHQLEQRIQERTAELVRTNEQLMQEIEDRKQAQETVESERQQLLSIFDSINEIIYITDPRTHEVLYANKAVANAFGKSPVGGLCYREFQGLESPCEFCTNDIILREKDKPYQWEYRNLILKRDYMATDRIIRWPDSRDVRFQFAIDITERRRAQAEKRKLEGQLLQAQKMEAIGTLAGGIAHDFNNILSVIVGNAELAIDDVPEENPGQESLKEIRQACLRGRDLVRQILSFSRRSSQDRIPIKIIPIFKETLKFMRSSIPTAIDINQNISCKSDSVLADPTQINQVLINLCTNAAHAMEERGGILEVSLQDIVLDESAVGQYQDLLPGEYVLLRVSDTGHGIDPRFISRIFDPYFTTKDVNEGTGLGLSVVHGIMKSHCGAITVESEPGKGATFNVLLPIIEAEVTAGPESPGAIPKGNERILYVDDEEPMAKMGKRMLEHLGYKVVSRTSSIEALELFRTKPDQFDLVITDMTMPNMTGDRLAKQLMQIRPDIPVILCTGYSERISEGRAKWFGIKEFVMKPLVMYEIAKTIRKGLDQKKEDK